ncbi:hypothetical protein GCM10008171_17040 [Methylopila jiangsuensis]|uniref:DUF5330 domain-containing protein n=1 Tax=Methylopila jiangsuensis TaxID=586230 RepID=A0A9W6N3L2_9HYPH|nr:DUF5330 domain-containing protein [Methylopila jiangsuensis]MDR6284037.1 hypothetical protein [Methylopila jiangsuensis]GLK76450.1 hypothetical protein GCM10008171_17040 [Methylopila jiangsuensis]
MMFLIRTAFWISVLMLVLPISVGSPDGKDGASIDPLSALSAAGATVSDLSSFCERQPDACSVGSQALKLVGERARASAELVGGYLAGDSAPQGPAAPSARAAAGRDTLTPADRKPAWRAPAEPAA